MPTLAARFSLRTELAQNSHRLQSIGHAVCAREMLHAHTHIRMCVDLHAGTSVNSLNFLGIFFYLLDPNSVWGPHQSEVGSGTQDLF